MAYSTFTIDPLNAQYNNEGTPIIMACRALNIDLVEELLKMEVDVNKPDVFGTTALITTIITPAGGRFTEHIKLDIIRALIEAGADISIPDYRHATPLICAAEKDYPEILKELIEKDIDQAAKLHKDDYDGDFYDRLTEKSKKFIDETFPRIANIKGFQQETSDLCAFITANNLSPLVNVLNADFLNGQSLLIKACKGQNMDLVKVLIEIGDHIDSKDDSGNTALIYAAKQGNRAILEELIKNEADVLSVNNEGKDFIDYLPDNDLRNWLGSKFEVVKRHMDSRSFGI
jgi:ankyrin repeat protein